MESYKLDACYDVKETVASIFAAEVVPIIPTIFRGYNATVFAYGATGSGKTHSMQVCLSSVDDHVKFDESLTRRLSLGAYRLPSNKIMGFS